MDAQSTLASYAAEWLATLTLRVHPRTAVNYAREFRLRWVLLGARPLAQISRRDVRDALRMFHAAGTGPAALRNARIALSACLECAVQDGMLDHNVARGASRGLLPPRARGIGARRALPPADLPAFLETAHALVPERATIFETLAGLGTRIGETLALEPRHVDADRARIRVEQSWTAGTLEPTKGRETRWVDASDALLATLQLHASTQRGCRWLFPSERTNMPLTSDYVERVMKRVLRAAGLPRRYSPGSLRHCRAVMLLEETGDLVFCSRQLGHRSTATTSDIYGATAAPRRLEAVNRLDSLAHRRDPLPFRSARRRPSREVG